LTSTDFPFIDFAALCERPRDLLPATWQTLSYRWPSAAMMKASNKEAPEKVGEEWLLAQCKDLLANGAPALHFYTLGKPHVCIMC
jgi:methylenetetrahydrofolate reductase (NADPH)